MPKQRQNPYKPHGEKINPRQISILSREFQLWSYRLALKTRRGRFLVRLCPALKVPQLFEQAEWLI
jgi:hypothetical protein